MIARAGQSTATPAAVVIPATFTILPMRRRCCRPLWPSKSPAKFWFFADRRRSGTRRPAAWLKAGDPGKAGVWIYREPCEGAQRREDGRRQKRGLPSKVRGNQWRERGIL